MFKRKKIKRIDRDKVDDLKTGESFWLIDGDGVVLGKGKVPKRRKDKTQYVEVEIEERGIFQEIAVQRHGKWAFANYRGPGYLVRPGEFMDITFHPGFAH